MNKLHYFIVSVVLLTLFSQVSAELRVMPNRAKERIQTSQAPHLKDGLLRSDITQEQLDALVAMMREVEIVWQPVLKQAHYAVFAGRTNAARNFLQQAVDTSELRYWEHGRYAHDWIMADILLSEGKALEAFQLLDSYQGKIGGTATQEHLFLAAFYAGLVTREDLIRVHNRLDDWFGPGVQEYLPSINTVSGAEALVLLLVASFSRQDENEIEFWLLGSFEADPTSSITTHQLGLLCLRQLRFMEAYYYFDLAASRSTGARKVANTRLRDKCWRRVRIANGEIER